MNLVKESMHLAKELLCIKGELLFPLKELPVLKMVSFNLKQESLFLKRDSSNSVREL